MRILLQKIYIIHRKGYPGINHTTDIISTKIHTKFTKLDGYPYET
jgi:hypothetical protein